MDKQNKRREFLRNVALGGLGAATPISLTAFKEPEKKAAMAPGGTTEIPAATRAYNGTYTGPFLNRLAFPIGGLGAGMFCLEGTGAISHMSVRHKPEIFNEPAIFAAIHVKGTKPVSKVLEGPAPEWKYFGISGSGNGLAGSTIGLPRFTSAECTLRFPSSKIVLKDSEIPLAVTLTGWSPFIPTDEDNSSLPAGAIEYRFKNNSARTIESIFSINSKNFLATNNKADNSITKTANGFVLNQNETKENPEYKSSFAIATGDDRSIVDYCWFRGGWWDPLTMAWNNIRDGKTAAVDPVDNKAAGASIFVPFSLAPGAEKTIRVMMAWYTPESTLKIGTVNADEKKNCDPVTGCCAGPADLGITGLASSKAETYKPWYSSRFAGIDEVMEYWKSHYDELRKNTDLFSKAFYASTLPPEVLEAVAANMTIIKSPTVLRQFDGRLWSWEGCGDDGGCCHGSCTHVWNYAQAIPHLFPSLERTLRNTEFCENQNHLGHQGFRANMPITPLVHDFHAASDGQLGGIMKVYRDWRISGDSAWLKKIFPMVKLSMDYCIKTWDPDRKGIVEEPHHNTYDIEFWGPDGMCTSFYLGALTALIEMGKFLTIDMSSYESLRKNGKEFLETTLFNGEYFFQKIEYKNLKAPDPSTAQSFGGEYSEEAKEILKKEGPKYQYGSGCLSDGVLGAWIGAAANLPEFIDHAKLTDHLMSVHKYNLKKTLFDHANPQRPAYALGHEGGLLLCTWPKGGKLSLPFVYSDEVWTGIEYQVASHLMMMGKVKEGLDIVRACRDRYDGRVRNPCNEYECGHWYARAMSSYGLLQGLTGLFYDAVDRTLYIDSKVGDFTAFLSTATGFGTVSVAGGKASVKTVYGKIAVEKTVFGKKKAQA